MITSTSHIVPQGVVPATCHLSKISQDDNILSIVKFLSPRDCASLWAIKRGGKWVKISIAHESRKLNLIFKIFKEALGNVMPNTMAQMQKTGMLHSLDAIAFNEISNFRMFKEFLIWKKTVFFAFFQVIKSGEPDLCQKLITQAFPDENEKPLIALANYQTMWGVDKDYEDFLKMLFEKAFLSKMRENNLQEAMVLAGHMVVRWQNESLLNEVIKSILTRENGIALCFFYINFLEGQFGADSEKFFQVAYKIIVPFLLEDQQNETHLLKLFEFIVSKGRSKAQKELKFLLNDEIGNNTLFRKTLFKFLLCEFFKHKNFTGAPVDLLFDFTSASYIDEIEKIVENMELNEGYKVFDFILSIFYVSSWSDNRVKLYNSCIFELLKKFIVHSITDKKFDAIYSRLLAYYRREEEFFRYFESSQKPQINNSVFTLIGENLKCEENLESAKKVFGELFADCEKLQCYFHLSVIKRYLKLGRVDDAMAAITSPALNNLKLDYAFERTCFYFFKKLFQLEEVCMHEKVEKVSKLLEILKKMHPEKCWFGTLLFISSGYLEKGVITEKAILKIFIPEALNFDEDQQKICFNFLKCFFFGLLHSKFADVISFMKVGEKFNGGLSHFLKYAFSRLFDVFNKLQTEQLALEILINFRTCFGYWLLDKNYSKERLGKEKLQHLCKTTLNLSPEQFKKILSEIDYFSVNAIDEFLQPRIKMIHIGLLKREYEFPEFQSEQFCIVT